jgi:hypothetical protein
VIIAAFKKVGKFISVAVSTVFCFDPNTYNGWLQHYNVSAEF